MKIGWMSEVELSLDGGSHGISFSFDLEIDDTLLPALAIAYYRTIVSPGDHDTPPAIDHECTSIDVYVDKSACPIMTDEEIEEL